MAIELPPVADHPNRAPFRGVLTLLDKPSDKPPAGARGHRVLLTRAAAEAALPSLLGMGLDYAPSLDRHDARRKVGIITEAEIVFPAGVEAPGLARQGIEGLKPGDSRLGAQVCAPALRAGWTGQRPVPTRASGAPCIAVNGYLFARDFPEIVREIGTQGKAGISGHPIGFDSQARGGAEIRAASAHTRFRVTAPDTKVVSLGMSYEIADAYIADLKASVWTVSEFTFTGAAVLRRDKAAYRETWIELA